MELPDFFKLAPRLTVRDPLADFLGAATDGVLEYGYEDAVKLAGHSCPTVASAYLLTCHALTALYPDTLPERGGVRVDFHSSFEEGVTGVIASVVTLLTGATQAGGFKGLAGRFVRRDLQAFAADIPLEMRFTRLDNGFAVDADSDMSSIPADPQMPALMRLCIYGEADTATQRQFATMWQDRVARIMVEHHADTKVFQIRPVAGT